jgi:plasmid replication initiation protein
MIENDKNLSVVQSNKLVEAHYKQEYTIQEQRTVLWLIGKIHKEDYVYHRKNELKTINISASDYAKLMDIPVSHVYRDAIKIGRSLMDKVLSIEDEESQSWLLVHWVSSMEYKNGMISVDIHPKLIPYLIELKGTFTSFKLENILYLNSSYAIKLYQLLSQYKTIGKREITLENFRSMLGISDIKTYERYNAIKEKILEISKREINAKTDISFSYKADKKGTRKVVLLIFKITQKQQHEQKKAVDLNKKIELQGEAKKCFSNCKGNCGAKLEEFQNNKRILDNNQTKEFTHCNDLIEQIANKLSKEALFMKELEIIEKQVDFDIENISNGLTWFRQAQETDPFCPNSNNNAIPQINGIDPSYIKAERMKASLILQLYVTLVYMRKGCVYKILKEGSKNKDCKIMQLCYKFLESDYVRHIRNSLAHGTFEMNIAGIYFENKKGKGYEIVATQGFLNKINIWIFSFYYQCLLFFNKKNGVKIIF